MHVLKMLAFFRFNVSYEKVPIRKLKIVPLHLQGRSLCDDQIREDSFL